MDTRRRVYRKEISIHFARQRLSFCSHVPSRVVTCDIATFCYMVGWAGVWPKPWPAIIWRHLHCFLTIRLVKREEGSGE